MKKKITLLVSLLSIMSLMSGCASTSSSLSSSPISNDSSSSEEIGNTITFVEAGNLVASLEKAEYSLSNGANVVSTTTTTGYLVSKEETLKVYSDSSSSSTGKVTRHSPMGRLLGEDTFVSRKKRQIDRFKATDTGKESSFNMYYSIYDYENGNVSSYKDSAGSVYIVNTASDAYAGGLSDGQFITESQYSEYTSLQVCLQVETALDDLYNDDYVLAKGITSIYYENLNSGNTRYYFTVDYSYDGDLNDIYSVKKELSFEVSNDKTKLLSATYNVSTTDTSKSDPDDVYESGTGYNATLNYGTREEVNEESLLDVSLYFLESVSEVNVLTNNSRGDRVVSDPTCVDYDGKYIFLEAKKDKYTPSKAVSISLTNKSSSNEDVVKLESSGHFAIVAPGTTTLTATYSGRDEYGVYEEKEISIEVTIIQKEVTEFSINTESCNIHKTAVNETTGEISQGEFFERFGCHDKTLFINNNYTFTIKANSSKATDYTVSSSDETKAKVEVESGSVTVYALAKGEVNITVAIKGTDIKTIYHFNILDNDDTLNLIKGKTYTFDKWKTTFYYTGLITFNNDGSTGSLTLTNYDSKTFEVTAEETTKFSYTIIDGYIVFDDINYAFGSPNKDGSSLFLERPKEYATSEYKVKA